MSDILIRGMEMPKDCESCSFCDYEQANCLAANDRNTLPHSFTQRPVWCPLVEVPPHGRLIDADALKAKEADVRDTWADCDGREDTVMGFSLDMLDHAPTILPAEEAEA